MTDVRYAPPVTNVADAIVNRSAVRPRSVTHAVQLFWAAFFASLASEFFSAEDWTTGTVLFVAAIYVLDAVLNILVGRGRNWARITKLVLLLLGAPVIALLLWSDSEWSVAGRVLTVLSLLLSAPATWLLFSHPGRLWFSPAR